MARNFDFKKYKAITDYIQASTGGISTSIDNLIKGSIELRASSVASIVKYSTSITEIVVGRLSSAIGTDTWSSEGVVSVDIANGGIVAFEEDYKYDPDAMLPSSINEHIINAISTKFVKRSDGTITLQRAYDPTVTTFNDMDIPSLKFFKDNYVTKEDGVLYGKVILSSDSKNNHSSAVNKIIAVKLVGSSVADKQIKSYSKKVLSNFFDVSITGKVSLSSNPTSVIIGAGVVLNDAPTEKSLITLNNIESAVVRKDLSNLTPCLMENDGTSDDRVMTVNDAIANILSVGTISEDVKQIATTCQPSYTTSLYHPSIETASNAIEDKYSIAQMQSYLNANKEDFVPDDAVSMYTRLFALTPLGFTSSQDDVANARGKLATSIKMIYEMTATRLLLENDGLFINNAEYVNQQTISSLLLKSTSSPEFNRRPIAMSAVNDAAIISDMIEKLSSIVGADTGGKVRSW